MSFLKKDVFPLPLADNCLDTLAGNKWFSKIDANSAYWQIGIKESDRKKTAFTTKYGLFEHVQPHTDDQFTKWVEVIPVATQTAEVTARALVSEFFSRFG